MGASPDTDALKVEFYVTLNFLRNMCVNIGNNAII